MENLNARDAVADAERILCEARDQANPTFSFSLEGLVFLLVEQPIERAEVVQESHLPPGWAWVSFAPARRSDPVLLMPLDYKGPTFTEYYGRLVRHLLAWQPDQQWGSSAKELLELLRFHCGGRIPDGAWATIWKWAAQPQRPMQVLSRNRARHQYGYRR